jgi:hypothetical protein
LAQSDEKKIQVEEELELLIEDERKKCKGVVLLISDDVGRKPGLELV